MENDWIILRCLSLSTMSECRVFRRK